MFQKSPIEVQAADSIYREKGTEILVKDIKLNLLSIKQDRRFREIKYQFVILIGLPMYSYVRPQQLLTLTDFSTQKLGEYIFYYYQRTQLTCLFLSELTLRTRQFLFNQAPKPDRDKISAASVLLSNLRSLPAVELASFKLIAAAG